MKISFTETDAGIFPLIAIHVLPASLLMYAPKSVPQYNTLALAGSSIITLAGDEGRLPAIDFQVEP